MIPDPTQFNILSPDYKNKTYKFLYSEFESLKQQMQCEADAYEARLELLRTDALRMAAELAHAETEGHWTDILNQ